MSGLSRSVTCVVVNTTGAGLKLSTKEFTHGSPDVPIPERIESMTSDHWVTSTAGVFTGTQGWAVFEIEGGNGMFEVDWNNPFVGTNEFKQIYHPPRTSRPRRWAATRTPPRRTTTAPTSP